MENENVTITLTVAQWNALLGALSTAPFQVYTQVMTIVNDLQTQAAPQIEEAKAKYPPPSENGDAVVNPS